MIVIILTNCPPFLRGDLTKWLYEIGTNVFVGTVSARVRDNLWNRIVQSCSDGKVTMIYSVRNEQRFEFRVHNSDWDPVDFEGLKLMRKPLSDKVGNHSYGQRYSKASRYGFAGKRNLQQSSDTPYSVLHLTTTGLKTSTDLITGIDLICVKEGVICGRFSRTVRMDSYHDGVSPDLHEALMEFFESIDGTDVLAFQATDALRFIDTACKRHGIPMVEFDLKDIQAISKNILYNLRDHSFEGLIEHYGLNRSNESVTGQSACETMYEIYERLIGSR